MATMGTHSKPADGTVTANGHTLAPFTIGDSLTGRPRGPVSALPQPNGPERRRRWWRTDGAIFIAVALFNVAVVAVVAFSGSWQHQYELSIHLGQAHWVAGMQPLSVEGLIAAASLVIWYAARHHHGWPWAGYLVLAAGVGQTVLMNLGADHPDRWPWLGPEISVWPAVAFVAAYEMAVWLVRKRQDGDDGDDHPDVQPREDKAEVRQPDSAAGKQADKRVDKPRSRKTAPARTAMDKAAAAIRDNPHLDKPEDKAELARIAGVSTKTIQRARNGSRP